LSIALVADERFGRVTRVPWVRLGNAFDLSYLPVAVTEVNVVGYGGISDREKRGDAAYA
jgi:hypothetical protein